MNEISSSTEVHPSLHNPELTREKLLFALKITLHHLKLYTFTEIYCCFYRSTIWD